MNGDAVVHVFLAAKEIQTLLQCCCVCKPWRDLIRSGWFRKEWSERHPHEQSSVFLSFTSEDWCGKRLGVRRWVPPSDPASGKLSPFLDMKFPGFKRREVHIVASSNGLVAASLDYRRGHYAVGNPVTGEWVHLPLVQRHHDNLLTEYWLRAHSSGQFKFLVFDYMIDANYMMVYSSQTRSWNISKVIPETIEEPWAAIQDMEEGWISVKPPVELTAHSLSSVVWWSYGGQAYLAGYIEDSDACPVEVLVWKASRVEKQEQAPVSTPTTGGDRLPRLFWDTGANKDQVARHSVDGDAEGNYAIHGEGNLCAFAAYDAVFPCRRRSST